MRDGLGSVAGGASRVHRHFSRFSATLRRLGGDPLRKGLRKKLGGPLAFAGTLAYDSPMRLLRLLVPITLMVGLAVFAQEAPKGGKKGGGPPKNLKILPADANLIPTMRSFAAGLGVQCDFCHEMDRSSDDKPQKNTARMMITMVKDINSKFPDGQQHVTCYTCHRGAEKPLTAPPAQ
jgi:hypothetical protein